MAELQRAAYHASLALLPTGWAHDVRVDVETDGTIAAVVAGSTRDGAEPLAGPVIPGMPNVHSHAFQRAFAGRTERRTGGEDSFWTWREAMYAAAERLDPEQFEAVAAGVYLEMLRAGYTGVGEFHYLHNDRNGRPYADRAELAGRVIAAAERVGIALTLLPVLYTYAGFAERVPELRQRRFILSTDAYLALWDQLRNTCLTHGVRLGAAPHSLRAVAPEQLALLLHHVRDRDRHAPIHIHVAEQEREVEEAVAHLGARPVAWLLANADVGDDWCLVHATHVDDAETTAMAASGAVAGLCPTTEANLGDGFFPLQPYLRHRGRIGIGSDSHASIDAREELRWLEYGQRLAARRRALACDEATPSVGEYLYPRAAAGGARALGRNAGQIAVGRRADFVVLDGAAIAGGGGDAPTLLDRYLFATGRQALRDVVVGGRWVIANGHHLEEEAIERDYRRALSDLFPS